MYTQEDILKALQNGQDAEALTKEFTDALNAAIKEKSASDKEAARKEKVQKAKIEEMDSIIRLVAEYVEKYYPSVYDPDYATYFTGERMVKVMDDAQTEISEMEKSVKDAIDNNKTLSIKTSVKSNSAADMDLSKREKEIDDAFKKFFKKNNIWF